MKESKVIGFDENTYRYWLKKEESIFKKFDDLLIIATQALGDVKLIEDKSKFLESPYDYTVKIFCDKYCKDDPQHLDKGILFKNKTNISKSQMDDPARVIMKEIKEIGKYAPQIIKSGLKSTLSKEDFNIYLNEDKKEEYEAIVQFLEVAKTIKDKFNGNGHMSLVRYHESILLGNNFAEININYFKA